MKANQVSTPKPIRVLVGLMLVEGMTTSSGAWAGMRIAQP